MICGDWTTLAQQDVDGVPLAVGPFCAEHAVLPGRVVLAVRFSEHDDPRDPRRRHAPTHARLLGSPSVDEVRAAVATRRDLSPAPSVPAVPDHPDARQRWVTLNHHKEK